jgi:hypothetical protein
MDVSSMDVEQVPLVVEETYLEQQRGGVWASLEHPNGVSGKRPLLEKELKPEVQPYETPLIRAA